jgi:hypothetical protein
VTPGRRFAQAPPPADAITSRSGRESRFRRAHVRVSARAASFATTFPIRGIFGI